MTDLPQPGPEVERLMRIFEIDHGIEDEDARAEKVSEAQRILRHGPAVTGKSDIGLALGFVQSGKTMSFTTLAALAADTGYRLIIVILGNTHLLVGQNTDRLLQDLRIQERADEWKWAHRPMPKATEDLDFFLAQEERVVLVTVLKHAKRLNAVAAMLERSNLIKDADALIIDDEGDQASLNAGVRQGKVTPTYASIQRVRAALPRHLYVQYTATPFAPLLLEPQDDLSPSFLELLTPGEEYTGGTAFFLEHRDAVVRPVTDEEAEERAPEQMPKGLERALTTFLVSSALLRANGRLPGTVSMLVHTSGMKADHRLVAGYVQAFVDAARARVAMGTKDIGRIGWRERMQPMRDDLSLHGCDDVDDGAFDEALDWCVKLAKVWIVNSSAEGEQPDWSLSPVNILIGGNKLDRGFTVKGLTTTYMTRRATAGQADTIEQRARCYGYKRRYIESCRFFAPTNVINAFTALVHTEADMRASLHAWTQAGKPLQEWSASHGLLLPDDLRPTRPTVLDDPYSRGFTGWSFLRRPSFDPADVEAAWKIVGDLDLGGGEVLSFGEVRISLRRDVATSGVTGLVLRRWPRPLSAGWDHDALIAGLEAHEAAKLLPALHVALFERVADGVSRARERAWYEPDGFDNLMQGRNPGTGYAGDRNVLGDVPQLQIHRVRRSDGGDETLALALFIPGRAGAPGKVVRRRR